VELHKHSRNNNNQLIQQLRHNPFIFRQMFVTIGYPQAQQKLQVVLGAEVETTVELPLKQKLVVMIADTHLFSLVQEWEKVLQEDHQHQGQQHPPSKLLLADLTLKP
jgi:hypothetical protein